MAKKPVKTKSTKDTGGKPDNPPPKPPGSGRKKGK